VILITHREIIGKRENAEKGPPEVSAIPPKNERRAESPPKNSTPHPLCLQALQVADAKKKWLHTVEEGKKKKKEKGKPYLPTPHRTVLPPLPSAATISSPLRPALPPHATVPAHPSPRRRPHLPHGAPARGRGLPLTPPPSSPRSYRTPPPPTSPTPPASSASLTPSATPSVPSTTPPRFVRLSATPRRHGSPAAPPHQVPPLRRTGRHGSSGHRSAPPQSPYRCVHVFNYRSIDSSC